MRLGYEDFKKSRRRLRNEQDDAKNRSEKLRDELNKKWSAIQRLAEGGDGEDSHESSASFQDNNQDESTADSVYAAPSATYGEDEASYDMLHDLPPAVSPEVPANTAGVADCDSYDYDELQGEYWTSFDHHQSLPIPTAEIGYAPPYARFPEGNQDEPIPITEDEYAPPNAPTYSPMTPPHSSKESDNSNLRGHGITRRERAGAVVTLEALRETADNSKSGKTRSRASAAVAFEGRAAKSRPPPSDGPPARSRGQKRKAPRKGKSKSDPRKSWE
jgi:hypothetical protein